MRDVEAAVVRAAAVREEQRAFLAGRSLDAAAGKAKDKGLAPLQPPPPPPPPRAAPEEDEAAAAGGGHAGPSGARAGGAAGPSTAKADLDRQIAAALRARTATGDVIPSSAFAADGADGPGASECLKPSATLSRAAACDGCGGGRVFCDAGSVAALGGAMPPARQAQLRALRAALSAARAAVGRALPELRTLLSEAVHDGYDASPSGLTYLGFCSNDKVIINLLPVLRRLPAGRAALPSDATHELILTICHELAHLLERGGDHGPSWRETQDRLVQAVLFTAAGAFAADGRASCRCRACAGGGAGNYDGGLPGYIISALHKPIDKGN